MLVEIYEQRLDGGGVRGDATEFGGDLASAEHDARETREREQVSSNRGSDGHIVKAELREAAHKGYDGFEGTREGELEL